MFSCADPDFFSREREGVLWDIEVVGVGCESFKSFLLRGGGGLKSCPTFRLSKIIFFNKLFSYIFFYAVIYKGFLIYMVNFRDIRKLV